MSSLVSLPVYDIFAYLMIGIATIAAADLIFGTRLFFRAKWGASAATIMVVVGYIIGQLIGLGSTIVIERAITIPVFGQPINNLLPSADAKKPGKILQCIGSSYFDPLETNTQKRIFAKMPDGRLGNRELFWEAYNTAKQNNDAFERITLFSRQYHYSRNMAFASFLAAFVILAISISRAWIGMPKRVRPAKDMPLWLTRAHWQFAGFTIVGVFLYLRYLYYFRAHTIEVLTSYAYGKL